MLKSMNFLSGKSRGKASGGTKSAPLAPVILGLVPRILFQRVSNLVNKFALLLHKCWFTQDSWDKPKNDGCRGRGFSLLASKQRSVAYGNKVIDTRLPQPAGCGDKYDVLGWNWGRMLSIFCMFFKYPSPDAKASPSPARGEGYGLHRPWCNKILGTRPRMTGARGAGFVRLLRRYTTRNDAVTNGEGLHRPWCNKILGTRPRMTGGKGAGFVRLLRRYTPRNDSASNGEGLHRPWCHKILGTGPSMTGGRGVGFVRLLRCARNDVSSVGRSMIEMLGVLAIIGVLSVGGIAGYSKAMEKWKVTRAIDEYSHLTFGLLEHLDDIKRNSAGGEQRDDITGLAQSLNLIPNSWTRLNNSQFEDAYGNTIQLYVRDDKKLLIFDIFIGSIKTSVDGNLNSPDFSSKLCMDIFQNLVVPLHSAVEFSGVWRSVQGIKSFVGDKYCTKEMKNSGSKCLAEASLADFQEACSSCGKSNEICDVSYNF